jgi:hypothetical protein
VRENAAKVSFLSTHADGRNPTHSVRLFCCSSDYFRAPHERITAMNTAITNRNIPIEYPSVPDVRVDDMSIPFKERGLRGKAGSAPPFDMNKSARGLQFVPNRLASVSFGHTGATTGKKKDIKVRITRNQAEIRNSTFRLYWLSGRQRRPCRRDLSRCLYRPWQSVSRMVSPAMIGSDTSTQVPWRGR